MDKLERLRQVAAFWNWLPAFRAVAETEHVGDASEKFFKSPSALSRSVSLLEDELGVELFDREGRNIQLNEKGETFLKVVRKAMRLVDDGLDQVGAGDGLRDWRVAGTGRVFWLLEEVAPQVSSGLEEARLEFEKFGSERPAQDLLEGRVDVLLTTEPVSHPELEMRHLANVSSSLFVPSDHDLAGEEDVEPEDLADQKFVGTRAPETGVPPDAWPREFDRELACMALEPEMAARIAAGSGWATTLPDLYAELGGDDDALERIDVDFLLEMPVFAWRRSALVEGDLAQRTIDGFAEHRHLGDAEPQ